MFNRDFTAVKLLPSEKIWRRKHVFRTVVFRGGIEDFFLCIVLSHRVLGSVLAPCSDFSQFQLLPLVLRVMVPFCAGFQVISNHAFESGSIFPVFKILSSDSMEIF